MKLKYLLLVSFVILIIGLTAVSATDSDDTATTDNSGSDVAIDSSSSTSQATDTSTHTDSSVDKTSDASTTSSQKTDVTSQQTTQKVSQKTTDKTQTTSDTNAKASSDTTLKVSSDSNSQSTQSSSQSTSQSQSDSNTTNLNTNTVSEKTVDTNKVISTADNVTSEADTPTTYYIKDTNTFYVDLRNANPGDIFVFDGTFTIIDYEYEKNLVWTSISGATFKNTKFTFESLASGTIIENLSFDNCEIKINSGTSNMTIQNCTFLGNGSTSTGKEITVDNANNIIIGNNSFSLNDLSADDSYAIGVYSSSSNVSIVNNTIKINGSSKTGKGITVDNANNITIGNNSFSLNDLSADDSYAIGVYSSSSNVSIVNNTIKINGSTSTGKGIIIDNSKNLRINYNNVTLTDLYTNDTYAIGVLNSSQVNITDNNIKVNNSVSIGKGIVLKDTNYTNILNNNITVSALAINITYEEGASYEGTVDTCGVGILNSSLVNVTSNNVNVSNSVASNDLYSTVAAINVQGSNYFNRDTWYINITQNNIFFKNDVYAYGISVNYNTSYIFITNNQIKTIDSNGYQVNGIDVSTSRHILWIKTNNINVSATGLAYGIGESGSLSRYINNTVITFNNITVSASDSRAMELYFVNNTTVAYNNLYAYGNSSSGIGIGAGYKINITYNNMTIKGESQEVSATYDSIPLITCGVYVVPGETYSDSGEKINITSSLNSMKYNNIYTTGVYAVNLTGYGNTITFNYLTSNVTGDVLNGDKAVLVSGSLNDYSGNTGSTLSGEYQESDEEASTHIITEENYQFFFEESTSDGTTYQVTSGGLSDLVNDGDTLDIQGNITLTYKIAVDKSVNIISSTNDGMFIGDGDRIRLTIVENGSNTNITGITFYDMELFTIGAQNITLDHINITNVDVQGLGTNTGVFCMRGGSSNFNITNSYFHTEENGGHSTVVMAGASNVRFINNTIEGVGQVGNLLYITTYNTANDTSNGGSYIVNNTIIGPEIGSAICIAVCLSGHDFYMINNFINYTGSGVRGQWTSDGDVAAYGTLINNTIIGTGINLIGSNLINNTADYITARGDNITVTGNTVQTLSVNSTNSLVENNTIGTTSANSTSIDIIGSNIIIENNNMLSENLLLNINGSSNILNNNIITSNNIQLSINESNIISNNMITSDNLQVNINGSDMILDTNIISSDNLQVNINGSNVSFANSEINTNTTYNITGDNNIIENITTGENSQVTINGSNNTFKNIVVNGSATYNITGNSNVIANNTATKSENANSYLLINGSSNIIENNTIYRVTNDISIALNSVISISDDSNDNIVRYNDIVCYDLYRSTSLIGDDSVYVTSGTIGNIVQDNYGTIPEIVIPTPEETNYTYITYNVTSMAELISALDDIKTNGTYSEDTKYVINLLEGDYTVTEAITWGDATSDVREVIINGTGQTINGNGFNSTFLTIASGYSLILDNVTITNLPLERSMYTIVDNGNLTILNSVLDQAGYISCSSSTITINNTNITQTAITGVMTDVNITNSRLYDTDLSSLNIEFIGVTMGNLTFLNNNVSNISTTTLIDVWGATSYIENNIFTDINTTRNSLIIELSVSPSYGTLINNTIINGITISISNGRSATFYNMDNHYINCSLPVNITNPKNSTITTEDYIVMISVSSNSNYGANVEGQLIVSIDGKEYKTFDLINGKTNIIIENSALNLLDNQIEVQFVSKDGNYLNTSTTFTITVAEDMAIKIPEGSLYSGDTISIPVQVAVNGSLAKDGYVILKVNGKTVKDENGNPIEVQVDENGNAVFNYTIPDTTSDEYNITVVYAGSEGIVRSSTTLTRSLKTATIVVDQITAKPGQTVTLTAHITDQNGNAVTTGKLVFKLNGKTLKDSEGNTLYATINNGVATLVYTIPDNFSAKDYILTAVYQGTGFERSEANSTLTLIKTTPTIVPDSSVFGSDNKITINQGTDSVNIKATINDPETNAPIDSTTVVTIKINDKTVTQQYVSNGQIDITVYTSSFKNPEYNITVVVGENSQYERTSFNGTLEIVSPNGLATSSSYNGTLLVKED